MALPWTPEQILAMAPDSGSAKSGRELANARKWQLLGATAEAAWGLCQGSGKDPYQASIDLSEPAFRCSCPSRKFPCKHGLGLLLLLAQSPAAFTDPAPPAWLTTWLEGRVKRAAAAQARAEAGPSTPDLAAQAKREASRVGKVQAGVTDLDRWLSDLVRHGLADAPSKPYSYWDGPAARLVDAQAPGLARRVRDLAGVAQSGDGWPGRLLDSVGRLHLLLEGFRRIDSLPAPLQAEVRTAVGWTLREEDLAGEPAQRDGWTVLGQHLEEEEKLKVQRTWIWGERTGQAALVLDFAYNNGPLDKSLVPGTTVEAEVVYYPAAYPQRALVRTRHGAAQSAPGDGGYATIEAALADYAAALGITPWLDLFPLALAAVTPLYQDGRWAVRDADGVEVPLAPAFARGWHLLALSGGRPVRLFGEWDGTTLHPLTAWVAGRVALLT